jgi:hypothetical protein
VKRPTTIYQEFVIYPLELPIMGFYKVWPEGMGEKSESMGLDRNGIRQSRLCTKSPLACAWVN